MLLKTLFLKGFLSLSCSPSSSPSSLRSSILIGCFSTFSSIAQSNPPSSRRHQEEESRNVRVSVWWDFENCNVPAGVNVFKVAQAITAAVRTNGIKGPIQITAFGDVLQLSRANQEALSSTGINLTHIPHGGKNSADRSLLIDLMYWVSQNPPPAHIFLVSGDKDFAGILHRLRMNNYNILLASTETVPSALCSAASIMWHWNALVRGENLTGRHFNQPPDGPYGSWYGHYRVPLEDPFSVVEQPTCLQGDELPEASTEPKFRPIPKAVTKQIRQILSFHPKGISITELRSELEKANVGIDKDFYGYKKFSRFLSSIPHILKLQSSRDGQIIVSSITAKAPEPFEPNPVPNIGNQHVAKSLKSNVEGKSASESSAGTLFSPTSNVLNAEERKVQQSPHANKAVKVAEMPPEKVELLSPAGEDNKEVVNAQISKNNVALESEVGLFKKVWQRWFGFNGQCSDVKTPEITRSPYEAGRGSEKKIDNIDGSEKKVVDTKCTKPPNHDNDPVNPAPCQSPIIAASSRCNGKESRKGLFHQIMNWCKFWSRSPESNSSVDRLSEALPQVNSYDGNPKVSFDDSVWQDMESFIGTPSGMLIISQSRTREHMAQNLQKEGPLILRTLTQSDAVQLVDMLISEKKWVGEYPSEATPFKLARSIGRNFSLGASNASNGLSSLFMSKESESGLQKLLEGYGNRENQNISGVEISLPVNTKKPVGKSRSEILADCQKLVDEMLKEFPDGYNIGSFRKAFLEKYGYHLDIEKLGYKKLASFLQTMPGVKIESTYIIPSSRAPKCLSQDNVISDVPGINAKHTSANSDGEFSNLSKKDDESDSLWEELGPVDYTASNRKEFQSVYRREAIKEMSGHKYGEYESSHLDDDLSDSEGESSTVTETGVQANPGLNNDDSSLLQILDSWYSSNKSDNGKEKLENAPVLRSVGSKMETSLRNYDQKPRPRKSFSFVADAGETGNEKALDNIIGGVKKSSESSINS